MIIFVSERIATDQKFTADMFWGMTAILIRQPVTVDAAILAIATEKMNVSDLFEWSIRLYLRKRPSVCG